MIVRLELDFNSSSKEEEYMRTYLGHMSSSKNITILDIFFLEFLEEVCFEKEDELNKAEKEALVRKIIPCILENKEALLNLIIPSISHLYSVVSSPIIKKIYGSNCDLLIEKVSETLKEDEVERKKLVQDIWSLLALSCLKANHLKRFLKVLIDSGDLSRLLKNNDDLCKVGEFFPQSLSSLVFRELCKPSNKELCKRLVTSEQELDKIQQYFPFLVKKKPTRLNDEIATVLGSVGLLFSSNNTTNSTKEIENHLPVCDGALYKEEEIPMGKLVRQ